MLQIDIQDIIYICIIGISSGAELIPLFSQRIDNRRTE